MIYQKYLNELNEHLDLIECRFCHQLFKSKNLILVQQPQVTSFISKMPFVQKLIDYEKLIVPFSICKEYCMKDLNSNKIPRFSILNNMYIEETPMTLANLNFFELILIKLGCSFQIITQLAPITKSNYKRGLFKAKKGLSIFLPLNTTKTFDHINQTLPSFENLKILVEKVTNDNHNLWKTIVDLVKVEKALKWLKSNNHLYQNILIDLNESIFSHNNIFTKMNNNSDINSTILHKPNEQAVNYNNFTIENTNHSQELISDIEQYTAQKISSKPFDDQHENKDHYCFPNIFPTGKYGMYHKREILIKPAMYCRWILRQKIQTPRRDIQFLFSLFHNKEINAINQGIYAMLNARNYKVTNAKTLLEQLDSKNQKLEVNIFKIISLISSNFVYGTSDLKLKKINKLKKI